MQEQYLILQQSYQVLQQNSQDQQASLLEKLEKSYDAFNEKFTRVEELEEKLNKRRKNDEERNDRTEDKVNVSGFHELFKFRLNYKASVALVPTHKYLTSCLKSVNSWVRISEPLCNKAILLPKKLGVQCHLKI